jgi:hypothetical protein
MSLINDALKRARETQRNDPPTGTRPLRPVESSARGGNGWILAVAAVLFLAAAGLFIGPKLFGHKASPAVSANKPGIPAPPAKGAPAPAPQQLNVVPATPTEVRVLPPAATNTTPPPAAATEQLPRVQGIIFSTARPLAIVDGQTVGVGDGAGNFKVKEIFKNSVVFQRPDGSQKTLEIGE